MEVLRTAILDFCRRKKGNPFRPSEIVQQMFPEDWEFFVEDLNAELLDMWRENLIEISQNSTVLVTLEIPDEPVSILEKSKPK